MYRPAEVGDFSGRGNEQNRWRVVNAYLLGEDMATVGPTSLTGPMLTAPPDELEPDDT